MGTSSKSVACSYTLVPSRTFTQGGGWSGATSQPADQGSGTYSTCKALCAWSSIPFQRYATDDWIYVTAFHVHATGINYVEMSLSDNRWVRATQAVNPLTGKTEYACRIKPSLLSDSTYEVRARVFPATGRPVVLSGFTIYANAGGTLTVSTVKHVNSSTGSDSNNGNTSGTPYLTVLKALQNVPDGGTISIDFAGNYVVETDGSLSGLTRSYWTDVVLGSGVVADSVKFCRRAADGDIRPFLDKLHLIGINFDTAGATAGTVPSTSIHQWYREVNQYVWFEDSDWSNSIGSTDPAPLDTFPIRVPLTGAADTGGVYHVGGTSNDMTLSQYVGATFVAKGVINRCLGEAFDYVKMGAGLTINTAGLPLGSSGHADLLQYNNTNGNTAIVDGFIINGLVATGVSKTQPLFIAPATTEHYANFAIVDVSVTAIDDGTGPYEAQLDGTMDNGLIKNFSSPVTIFNLRSDHLLVPTNIVIENPTFAQMVNSTGGGPVAMPPPPTGVVIR